MRHRSLVSALVVLSLAACSNGSEGAEGDIPSPGDTASPIVAEHDRGAAGSGDRQDDPSGTGAPDPTGHLEDDTAPPWAASHLSPDRVPDVLLAEWRGADNRADCAPLAPDGRGPTVSAVPDAAVPRAADFGGGWGVAWDVPDMRSAFGVAGTGVGPSDDTYDDWPNRVEWSDGSEVGYGPEGGDGPKELAYLTIPGQACLYNVWSNLGRRHLEELIDALRFVETG